MSILSSLLGKPQNTGQAVEARISHDLPAPDYPIFVIGDVHGRIDLFEQILEIIDAEIGARRLVRPKLVFVGNVIDRGPNSAEVLTRLRNLTLEFPDNVTCLLGNHEQMCLDFLDAPLARFSRWAKAGAEECLESYHVSLPLAGLTNESAEDAAATLRGVMGEDLISWLRNLPMILSSGNLHVVHAAVDPRRPIEEQTPRVLTWGHPEFLTVARGDGHWIAHGHSRVERACVKDSRIAVDTGAWETDVLSCAMILPEGTVEFFDTRG